MIDIRTYNAHMQALTSTIKELSDRVKQLEAVQIPLAGVLGPHDILSATHTDSVPQAVSRGSLIYGDATPDWNELTIGAAGTVLYSDGVDVSWVAAPAAVAHNLLSATHSDTVVNGATRGSLVYGNSTPAWDELIIGGIAGSVVTRNANDVLWSTWALAGTAAQTYTFPTVSTNIQGGTGSNPQVAYWSATANVLAGDAGLTVDAANDMFIVADGGGVGISNADEKLEFFTAGYAAFTGCYVGIGTVTPTDLLHLQSGVAFQPTVLLENNNGSFPVIEFWRNDPSPNDNDPLGHIAFYGESSAGTTWRYAYVRAESSDVTNGDLGGSFFFEVFMDSTDREILALKGYNGSVNQGEIILNEDGQDIDTRIEAVGVADALEVRGSDGQITLGVLTAGIVMSSAGGVLSVTAGTPVLGGGSGASPRVAYWSDANTLTSDAGLTVDAANDLFVVANDGGIGIGNAAEKLEFFSAGYAAFTGCLVGVGDTAPIALLQVSDQDNGVGWKNAYTSIAVESDDAYVEIVSDDSGTWGSGIDFKQVDGGVFENTWGIVRQTNGDGAGDGSLRFMYGTNAASDANSTMAVLTTGARLGVNIAVPLAQTHIDQSSATGAVPVLYLDQGDVSEEHIICTMGGGSVDFPFIIALDVTTPKPALWWDMSEQAMGFKNMLGVLVENGDWIGNSSTEARFTFDSSGAPDYIYVNDAHLVLENEERIYWYNAAGAALNASMRYDVNNDIIIGNLATSRRIQSYITTTDTTLISMYWREDAALANRSHLVLGAGDVGGKLSLAGASETYFQVAGAGGGTNEAYIYGVTTINQNSATGADTVLALNQEDDSEEMINFLVNGTGAGYPVDTATAVGSAYGRLRVAVNGTFKYIQLYNA